MSDINNHMEMIKTGYEQIKKAVISEKFLNLFSVPYHFKDKDIRSTEYPNSNKHGIYIFFNKHSEVKYIGMAFFDKLKERLDELIDKKWIGDHDTEYFRTFPVPDEMYGVIPTIEMLLLKKYDPPLNIELSNEKK